MVIFCTTSLTDKTQELITQDAVVYAFWMLSHWHEDCNDTVH